MDINLHFIKPELKMNTVNYLRILEYTAMKTFPGLTAPKDRVVHT